MIRYTQTMFKLPSRYTVDLILLGIGIVIIFIFKQLECKNGNTFRLGRIYSYTEIDCKYLYPYLFFWIALWGILFWMRKLYL